MSRISPVIILVLCSAALAQQSSVHPVVDTAAGCLLGGSANGKWLSDDDIAPRIKGGETYRVLGSSGAPAEAVGTKPESAGEPCAGAIAISLTGADRKIARIGIAADWKPQPRPVHDISANKKQYEQLLAPELAKLGIHAKPEIRQLFRADLDGKGVFSVVGVARNFSYQDRDEANRSSRYSVVFVRQVVNGRVVTAILDSDHGDHEGGTSEISIAAIADLNGDARMEIVVRGHYLQGDYSSAYALNNGKPAKVLSCSCGE